METYQIPMSVMAEFYEKFCLNDSRLIACSESAFFVANQHLAQVGCPHPSPDKSDQLIAP
jgi:hypothetical protein